MNFDNGAKTTYIWGKNNLLKKQCWEKWISTCKRIKLDPYTTHKNQLE